MHRKVRIADIGRVVTGKTPATKHAELYGKSYPFITPSDIKDITSVVHTFRCISELGRQKHSSAMIPKDSVCFTCIASIGKMCITDTWSLTNQQINSVVVKKDQYDPYYLYYLLRAETERIASLASGVATPIINKSIFSEIELEIAPLPIQRKIAVILSAYDDLIENNLQRIKILEEMAQNLYREWFVKFRFPGHEKVRFVNSLLGRIPEGWEVKRLDQLVAFQNNGTEAGEHLSDRVYLPIDCLPRKSLAITEVKPWQEAQSSLHLFDTGDILFGAMRPYFHKVVIAPFKGVTRKTCFVFKSILPEYHAFSALTIFQESTVSFASAHSKGATIPYAVWPQSMDGMPVIVPPIIDAKAFQDVVSSIIANIGNTYFRNRNLRHTRDLLLSKLISGELDVTDVDIVIPQEAA